MFAVIEKHGMTCTRGLLLLFLTTVTRRLMRTLAIGTSRRQIPALFGRAFPGRMLLRAESTQKFPAWALGLHMPIFLAFLALFHPSFLAVRPIGERTGTPDRAFPQRVVGHNRVSELDHE